MTTGISSISSFASSLSNPLDSKENSIFKYDENGKIIGIKGVNEKDEEKKTNAFDGQNVQMKTMQYEEDRFVREKDKKEEEKIATVSEVKKQKTNVENSYKDYSKAISFDDKDLLKEMKDKNIVTQREISNLEHAFKKLINADASNTTVLESAKKFQEKAQKVQERAEKFENDKKAEEKRTNFATFDTAEDRYAKNNGLKAEDLNQEKDLFENNPFFKSAMATAKDVEKKMEEEAID